jgi:hypothetical protein
MTGFDRTLARVGGRHEGRFRVAVGGQGRAAARRAAFLHRLPQAVGFQQWVQGEGGGAAPTAASAVE